MKRISLIAAHSANRVIGLDNGLPWRLPPDTRRFKRLTVGHTMIMGRKTFDSIGRPLPGRINIVVTRDAGWSAPGVLVAHSVDEALEMAGDCEIFVAGGAEIYRQTLDRADRLQITRIDRDFEGDTFFPEIDPADWRLVSREDHPATPEIPFSYSFLVYDRAEKGEEPG